METQQPRAIQPLERAWAAPLQKEAGPLLEGYSAQVPNRDAIYLSTPITTGPKYVAWRRGTGVTLDPSEEAYGTQLKRDVIAENLLQVAPLALRIRERFPGRVVINPAEVEVAAWEQLDYHRFWLEVIDRFASAAVFADGWHLSTGCTLEFLHAYRTGLPCFTADMSLLEAPDAADLLTRASQELQSAHLDWSLASAAAEAVTVDGA